MTTTETAKTLQPTAGNPTFDPAVHYEAICGEPASVDPESVGWDLSFGSRINFGPDADGNLSVSLHLSDDAIARGIVHRAVTRDQVIGFAHHLLALTKGDDDIETIAASLAATAALFDKRVAERAEQVAAPRVAEARQQVAEVTAELERAGEFHERRIADLQAEFGRQIDARDKQIERLIAAAKAEGTR